LHDLRVLPSNLENDGGPHVAVLLVGCSLLVFQAEREYNALLDDKREEELGAVRRAIKKEKRRRGGRAAASEDAKLSVLERSLARLKQTRAERQVSESRRAALAQWKSSEREKVAAGKKPFFLKKRAQKELETEHRFEALAKGRGGKKKIEKLIEKRRKKNAAKDRRWLPEARRGAY
jgi:ribosomal RNA-processing protein 36